MELPSNNDRSSSAPRSRSSSEDRRSGDGTSSQQQPSRPVGSGSYEVQQGDCISSIAYEHGFFWQTLWDDPANAELKRERKTPFVLLPGDRVTIPELREKQESGATERRHRFRLKGVPAIVKIKVFELPPQSNPPERERESEDESSEGAELVVQEVEEECGEPRPAKNKPFQAIVDGVFSQEGKTDGEGMLKLTFRPNARQARIVIEPGTPRSRVIEVRLGQLDPVQVPGGQAQRLANLGFDVNPSGEDGAGLSRALAEFQRSQGMNPTGQADEATLDKLKQVHGS